MLLQHLLCGMLTRSKARALAAAAVQHEEEEEDRKHTGQKVPQLQQQKAAQTSSGFVELPTELLRAILALLNARDLAACAVTSKLLGALAACDQLWKVLFCDRWEEPNALQTRAAVIAGGWRALCGAKHAAAKTGNGWQHPSPPELQAALELLADNATSAAEAVGPVPVVPPPPPVPAAPSSPVNDEAPAVASEAGVGGVTEREAHIVYLLDGSGSVSESDFEEMRRFVATSAPKLCTLMQAPTTGKVAVVQFSSEAKVERPLTALGPGGQEELSGLLSNVHRLGSSTNLSGAFIMAGSLLKIADTAAAVSAAAHVAQVHAAEAASISHKEPSSIPPPPKPHDDEATGTPPMECGTAVTTTEEMMTTVTATYKELYTPVKKGPDSPTSTMTTIPLAPNLSLNPSSSPASLSGGPSDASTVMAWYFPTISAPGGTASMGTGVVGGTAGTAGGTGAPSLGTDSLSLTPRASDASACAATASPDHSLTSHFLATPHGSPGSPTGPYLVGPSCIAAGGGTSCTAGAGALGTAAAGGPPAPAVLKNTSSTTPLTTSTTPGAHADPAKDHASRGDHAAGEIMSMMEVETDVMTATPTRLWRGPGGIWHRQRPARLVILLSDGRIDHYQGREAAAQVTKLQGELGNCVMFALGVGRGVDRDELKLVTKGTNGGASTSQAFPSYLDLHVNEELAY